MTTLTGAIEVQNYINSNPTNTTNPTPFKDVTITGSITGVNFTSVNLTGVISYGVTRRTNGIENLNSSFLGLNNISWKICNGHLVGPGANLTSATLTGANLSFATLTGVKSGYITSDYLTTLPLEWKIINKYLIGPGANLTGANLTGVSLTGTNLTGTNLTDANLTGANLSGVSLSSATLTGIKGKLIGFPTNIPPGWKIINGYLVGPGADLTGADLAGANLTSADLTGANLASATLTGVTGFFKGTPINLPTGWSIDIDTNTTQYKNYFVFTPDACFNENTEILCLKENVEQYVLVQNLKKGDLVKIYSNSSVYKKIVLIGKRQLINNPDVWSKCMFKMGDLIVTGGHSILVDELSEIDKENSDILNRKDMIDDKRLVWAGLSHLFTKLDNTNTYTYYHFVLENEETEDNTLYGVWANEVLVETIKRKDFFSYGLKEFD
jgi:uncharacterized protein YjbI with pentapeptide repeats